MRLALAAAAMTSVACVTAASAVFTPNEDAPVVEPRPAGCHVDVFEDGQAVSRPHVALGSVVLVVSEARLKEQGPDGVMTALKAAACERGAFFITDLRALTTGTRDGLRYEAGLATLLGDDGRPVNELR